MVSLRTIFKRQIINLSLALLLVGLPLSAPISAYADDPSTCTAPAASTVFHYPNGADSSTFTYSCASGLFENAHFTYDPATGLRVPKDPVVYTCDPTTNTYNVTTWFYSPAQGTFLTANQNVSQPPTGASIVACPPPPTASTNTSGNSDPGSSINATGADSTNANSNTSNNNVNLNNVNNLNVNNTDNASALSGSVQLLGNTTAGNAATGNAAVVASEMNLLQSSNNLGLSGQPVTFVANINGNVNGDFLLDPSTISQVQSTGANSLNTNTTNANNNLTVNNTTNATLNNNLNVNAGTGNATADANTTAGNISTGNANAVANVVNEINSAVAAGKSFFGVVNINGNLNGDILLPPDFVNQLLAANVPTVSITGGGSVNNNNTNVNNTTNVTNTNNQGINNNVNATANTGTATASGNTTAGNVTTGSATTNITAFNLTGSKVIGSNDLLVFVNVLGKWVGLIVNAPAGSTAAELGGGITSTGANSSNSNNTNVNNNASINNKNNQQINNNINVSANSGNASATRNTTVGDVSTGNADAAVNLLNMENDSLTLSNWFGILFINVFGTWNGSFGVNTAAGDPITNPGVGIGTSGNGSTPALAAFRFVPSGNSGHSSSFGFVPFSVSTGGSSDPVGPAVTATLANSFKSNGSGSGSSSNDKAGHGFNWLLAASGASGFVFLLIGDKLYTILVTRLKLRLRFHAPRIN